MGKIELRREGEKQMKIAIMILVLFLGGCAMKPEDVVNQCEACRKYEGWDCRIGENGWTYAPNRVDCVEKRDSADERNKRAGKPCSDKGGVPILSSWDGTLKDCRFKDTPSKEVK
jgi:hypothetical protein